VRLVALNFFYDDVEVVQVLVDLAADVVYLAYQSLDAFGCAQRLLVESEACEACKMGLVVHGH
jgi:hypothetical protein